MFWLAVLGWTVIMGLLAAIAPFSSDEPTHVAQIRMFLAGDFTHHSLIPMVAGYHAVAAMVSHVTGLDTLAAARSVSICSGVVLIVLWYACARRLQHERPRLNTAQAMTLPILVPFCFLAYTDVLALCFTFGCLLAMLHKRMWLAGLIGIYGLFVRQDAVTWLLAIFLGHCVREYSERRDSDWVRCLLRQTWVFLLGFLGFACFVVLNGGVALGGESYHPVKLQLNQILFALLLMGAMHVPLLMGAGPSIVCSVRRHPLLCIVLVGLTVLAYVVAFKQIHPFNEIHAEYWRNVIIRHLHRGTYVNVLLGLPLLLTMCWLAFWPLRERWMYVFPIVAALHVASHGPIDPRYMMPAVCLWMLFRQSENAGREWMQLAYYGVLAVASVIGIMLGVFFP